VKVEKLSIVCVTFMDIEGIRRTLASLEHLVHSGDGSVKVFVQDGGSGAEIEGVRQDFSWANITSEPDSGLYDAMNKSLTKTFGDYVWFLNGGDEANVKEWSKIEGILDKADGSLLYFNYLHRKLKRDVLRRARPTWMIRHALPTSHQAILYPGQQAREFRFSDTFQVAGDYEYTAGFIARGTNAKRVNLTLSTFYSGGLSTQSSRLIGKEAFLVQRDILRLGILSRFFSTCIHFSTSRMAARHRGNL